MSTESKTRMTEGSISKKMILFAIPLFLGNLFQQLYNTADSLADSGGIEKRKKTEKDTFRHSSTNSDISFEKNKENCKRKEEK